MNSEIDTDQMTADERDQFCHELEPVTYKWMINNCRMPLVVSIVRNFGDRGRVRIQTIKTISTKYQTSQFDSSIGLRSKMKFFIVLISLVALTQVKIIQNWWKKE